MKKKYSRRINFTTKIFGLLMAFVTLSFSSGISQTTIKGTIVDESNNTVPGVAILIEGTLEGTVSDIDGKFSLTTEKTGQVKLRTSYTGYKSAEKEFDLSGGQVVWDITLIQDVMGLDELVVTGVANGRSKLESSVSITTLDPKAIENSGARTTAEIFRTIPGIKAEASAGDGNTNITVRGIPISSGGSRYLQIQEDGLPVLLYGDIAFGTQDQFVRVDQTIGRVEAIRGGSAATMTSNGPAGIVNFISKTGAQEGGMVGTSFGLDYNSFRTDFNYGAPISNDLSFNIGGFYRQGEGAKNANHLVNNGGQIKANLTKRYDNGYVRIYGKYLNDKSVAYMPMPIAVSGTNANPTWGSIDGFSANRNGLQSPFLTQSFGLGPDGNPRNVNVSDGLNTESSSFGASMKFDLGNGWTLTSNARMSINGGRFVAPFTAQVGTTASVIDGIVTGNGDTTATGDPVAYSLHKVTSGDSIGDTDNGLVQRIHMFDVELENFNNFMSDVKVDKDFGQVQVTAGVFKSNQNVEASWIWNSYLMEVGEDAELLNVKANGNDLTNNGQLAYGVPFWGNCCTGKYNTNYDVIAPYINTAVEITEKLNFDGGVRYDYARVTGSVSPSQQLANFDVNGDGTIDAAEKSVSRIDNANSTPVNYNYGYVSYSAGLNYLLSESSAVFGRYSQGYVGNGERATWHQAGPYLENLAPKNSLAQAELGYKKRFKNAGIFITAFYALTEEEAGVEATTQAVLSNDYQSLGVEFEGQINLKSFDFRGSLTFVDASIVDNDANVNIGNVPRRQPAITYSFMPSYTFAAGHSINLNVMGQSKAFAQDNNDLIMPAYTFVNLTAFVKVAKNTRLTLSVNNLTNTIGITESEEGSITDNQVNYVRARSIAGRTIRAGINVNF